MRKINRRNFLKVTGVLAAASALAACGGKRISFCSCEIAIVVR